MHNRFLYFYLLYVEYEKVNGEELTYVNKLREHDAKLHDILVTMHKYEIKISELEARDKRHEARIQELEDINSMKIRLNY